MKGKIALVTGASSGIGFEAARELARRGATVVLACRDKARGQAALDLIRAESGPASAELLLVDLGSLRSVREAAAEFRKRWGRLDALINNAGLVHRKRETTADGLEATFQVNHLGHFLLTNLLLDVLRSSSPSRVVNVSSGLHFRGRMDFEDLQAEKSYSGGQAYSNSKLANVLFTRELAKRLAGSGVAVNAVHPGVIATGLVREMPAIVRWLTGLVLTSPEKGARPLVHLAADPEVAGVSGRYFDKLKEKAASARGQDDAAAARLWRVSEKLAGISS